jgi:hypothetical protein
MNYQYIPLKRRKRKMMPATEENIILTIQKVVDMGGREPSIFDTIFTNKRLYVDYNNTITYMRDMKGIDKGLYIAVALFGVVGALAYKYGTDETVENPDKRLYVDYKKEREEQRKQLEKTKKIEDLIKSQEKPFVINYDELKKIKLKKRIIVPLIYLGCSGLKIECKGKNRNWVFAGEKFDFISLELVKLLQDKVEIK